jgi:hypothetical protein
MDYKDKTVLVFDQGLFVEWAVLLSRSFGRVYYYMPWEGAFPKSNGLLVGEGLSNVIRLREFWSLLDEIDLFIFPDVYHGTLQLHLESLGKRVWGCRIAEALELDRAGSKEFCRELGIPIGPFATIKGIDALREYLQEHDDVYVKVSTTRGDMESFHANNYKLIEPRIDELEHNLGAKKKVMNFIVEQAIDPAVETGTDGFCIDGQFPDNSMFGVEIKDRGYVLQTSTYNKLPSQIRSVNDKLRQAFANTHFRGFWSSEVRIKDGIGYLIDPSPRAGSPPSELYQNLITNWPDIFWNGAEGALVEPELTASFGAELLIISEWADKNWQAISFPPELRDNVKLRNCCIIEGQYYCVPQAVGCPEIGAVIATGNSLEDAIERCKEIAEQVEGHYITTYPEALDTAAEELGKLEED